MKTKVAWVAAVICTLTAGLYAAEGWQTKPFTEWSEQEVQKLASDSPWCRPYLVLISHDMLAPSNGRNAGSRPNGGAAPGEADEKIPTVARWQTALPIREAVARLKYRDEAGTAAEAKALVNAAQTTYSIAITGSFARLLGGNQEKLKAATMKGTSLAVKGKVALKPSDVAFSASGVDAEVTFTFPRSEGITADDKEIDFSTKIADETFRYRFHPKDMVFGGKLEL